MTYVLHHGDCLEAMAAMELGSVDAIVTDPPYGLEFMGKEWDRFDPRPAGGFRRGGLGPDESGERTRKRTNIPGRVGPTYEAGHPAQEWHRAWTAEALRVLPPSHYLLAFGGTRTWHRLVCAIEDAGFEIRDTLMWLHGQGFPKGTACLKPAWEPIILARKPGPKRALGIEECRVAGSVDHYATPGNGLGHTDIYGGWGGRYEGADHPESVRHNASGRYPANLILDEEAGAMLDGQTGLITVSGECGERGNGGMWTGRSNRPCGPQYGDSGGASRFFYCAKAGRKERGEGNGHPTVKPVALMTWLVKLVAAEGDTVLDPFMGSGTTGVACVETGRDFIGIEREAEYVEIARRRIEGASAQERLPV